MPKIHIVTLCSESDLPHAKDLALQLENLRDQVTHFFPEKILPGEKIPDVLNAHITKADILVLLLSKHFPWQKFLPLVQSRRGHAHLVPVLISPTTLPKELLDLQRLPRHGKYLLGTSTSTDDEWVAVVEELQKLFGKKPPQAGSLASYRANLGAALRLDRSKQWNLLLQLCPENDHFFFLLHGQTHQEIGHFCQRVRHMLNREGGRLIPHSIATVPLDGIQGRNTLDVSDLEYMLRDALSQLTSRGGVAEDLLAHAAMDSAVFLIFGTTPVSDLSTQQSQAFATFLGTRLPEIINGANPDNPVRILLAVQYERNDPKILAEAGSWGAAARKSGLRYIPLPPVRPPDWDDVEAYMNAHHPQPDAESIERMRRIYDDLVNRGEISFLKLAGELDALLGKL